MKTLVVVSHPELEASSTQQFLQASAASLTDVTWHHLDPIETFDVDAEVALLQAHQRIVFQFPLYWYMAPASLHRWLAAVWTKQRVYDEHGPLLSGKTLGFVVSYSQPEKAYQLGGSEGVTISELLAPYAVLARKTGLGLVPPLSIAQFDRQSEQDHQRLLIQYQQYLTLPHHDRLAEQADWFVAQLALAGSHVDLLHDQLVDRNAELADLSNTVHDLQMGESE